MFLDAVAPAECANSPVDGHRTRLRRSYLARGKVIWTEQSLHSATAEPDADTAEALLDQWGDADR